MLLVAALAASETGARFSVAVAVCLLPLPFLVKADALPKGLLALGILACLSCAIDFASGQRPRTVGGRLVQLLTFPAFIDPVIVARRARMFDWRSMITIVLALGEMALSIGVWHLSANVAPWLRWPARSLMAAIIVAAITEILSSLLRIGMALFGAVLPPIHDRPWLSRTLTEFWSRRWNLVAARWFRRHGFLPTRALGVTVALIVMFTISAAFHAYLIVAVNPLAAASWAAFFLLQPFFLVVERKMLVRRWPSAASRVWTIGILVSLLPLILWPLLPLFATSM